MIEFVSEEAIAAAAMPEVDFRKVRRFIVSILCDLEGRVEKTVVREFQ
jgi:hypothetical protein